MKKIDIQVLVGFFLLLGFLSLAYLSIKLGEIELLGEKGYTVYAEFERTGGIKSGATVEIAGVEIGKVKKVSLDSETYQAVIALRIESWVNIQEDAIASVKTKGILGDKYVQISPGGSDVIIQDGGEIRDTESAVDVEELISQFVFGKI